MGGAWREATPFPANYTVYNPRPESYLAIPDLENVQLLDHDTVEGMAVFQISGVRRETRTSPPRLPEQPEGEEVELVTRYTWLISKEDYRLVRRITEQHIGPAIYRTTTNFYGYDGQVDIEIPELAEQ
jgi:hypothetical protein